MFFNSKIIHFIPLFSHQNKSLAFFKEKTDILNTFFAELCSLINYSSKLPSTFFQRKAKVFLPVSLISNDIATINLDLDPNRAHSRHMISIHMLKVCLESISKPFQILHRFENVVSVHKKM